MPGADGGGAGGDAQIWAAAGQGHYGVCVEVRIVRVHVEERLLLDGGVAGAGDRIDPDAWRPLIMSFCQMYGLGGRAGVSRLAEIPERLYRPAAAMGR